MFNLDDCIACITNRTGTLLANNFEKMLVKYNINRSSWFAMYYINTQKEINQKELADKLGFKPASVVTLLTKLENEGLIHRSVVESDNRNRRLTLTEDGEKLFGKLIKVSEEYKNICTQGIKEEDLSTFRRILDEMLINSNKIR